MIHISKIVGGVSGFTDAQNVMNAKHNASFCLKFETRKIRECKLKTEYYCPEKFQSDPPVELWKYMTVQHKQGQSAFHTCVGSDKLWTFCPFHLSLKGFYLIIYTFDP